MQGRLSVRQVKQACKPGSVLDDHSSRPWVAPRLEPPTRGLDEQRQRPPIRCCSGWGLPTERVATPVVSSYLTVSPLPDPGPDRSRERPRSRDRLRSCERTRSLQRDFAARGRKVRPEPSAVCFLLHFPSPRGAWKLSSTLLYGARTFLSKREAPSDRPACFGVDSTPVRGCGSGPRRSPWPG
jgi:hypothetical protein